MKINRKLRQSVKANPCIICGNPICDPAHIKTRGAGNPDAEWNLIPLCRRHHREQEDRGWKWFINQYPEVGVKLRELGWTWETVNNKFVMYHEKLYPECRR